MAVASVPFVVGTPTEFSVIGFGNATVNDESEYSANGVEVPAANEHSVQPEAGLPDAFKNCGGNDGTNAPRLLMRGFSYNSPCFT